MRRYVVVASIAGARVYLNLPGRVPLKLIKTIVNAEWNPEKRSYFSGNRLPLRTSSRVHGIGQHPIADTRDPREKWTEQFIEHLYDFLVHDSMDVATKDILFVASPHLIGLLRKHRRVHPQTYLRWLTKDVAKMPTPMLAEYLTLYRYIRALNRLPTSYRKNAREQHPAPPY